MSAKKVIGKLDYIFYMKAVRDQRGGMDKESVQSAMLELAKDAFKAARKSNYKTFSAYRNSLKPKLIKPNLSSL